MAAPIDYKTIDLDSLRSDPAVKQLLKLAEQHPKWTISELVWQLSRSKIQPALSYNQASAIFQRLHMVQYIDYSTVDLPYLLSDPQVQKLLKLTQQHPDWNVSQLSSYLIFETRKNIKTQPSLTYKQASIILQCLNMATPTQRRLHLAKRYGEGDASHTSLSDYTDYRSADIPTLLSDPYVQELLKQAQQHPDWNVTDLVSQVCLQERRYSATLLYAYQQASIIFERLNMSTSAQRELRLTDMGEWERSSAPQKQLFSKTFPDLFFYLTHRKDYQEELAKGIRIEESRQPAATAPIHQPTLSNQTRQTVPVVTPPLHAPQPQQSPAPQLSYTPTQQATFRTFDRFFSLVKQFSITFVLSFLFFLAGSLVLDTLFHAQGLLARTGMFLAFTALSCGLFFFLYSLKYYLTIAVVLSFSRSELQERAKRRGIGAFLESLFGISIAIETQPTGATQENQSAISLQYDLSQVQLERHPFISIHVATFNEKRVIDRFLLAATSMDYDNYEIIVADDSTDETVQLLEQWKNHPRVKISHRMSRAGFKGAALKEALSKVDPRTEFILVFDADFIPYPDSIVQFLKYFQALLGNLQLETIRNSHVAAVQGYQWHVLNKSENWITRGVRTEYAGSYVIERSGTEVYQGLKQISGSVYMMRRDILQQVGWGTSITEDFELTLKLYERGYKVVYTPYIQAPAEAVSTIKRLIRQRMRWAEGHSFNVKKVFGKLLFSQNLTLSEKLEFLYLSPYYLQAFFFLLGTFSWFTAETIFRVRLPFWTETWGWSLVLTNLFALPLMNMIGLFMEESDERDYLGIISFILLSYLVAPFQAFAAVKGFLEKEEGPWFRTPKTGRITDSFVPGRIGRFVRGIFGGQPATVSQAGLAGLPVPNSYAHFSFQHTVEKSIRSTRARWVARTCLVCVLVTSLTLVNLLPLSAFIPQKLNSRSSPVKQFVSSKGVVITPVKETFGIREAPEFALHLDPKKIQESRRWNILGVSLPFGPQETFAAEHATIATALLFGNNRLSPDTVVQPTGKGTYAIRINNTDSFQPGKYTLEAKVQAGKQEYYSYQDFSWGVLAINTKKDVYRPGETIDFGFGVLNDQGRTICDASLSLAITIPSEHNRVYALSTHNGTITPSGKCSANSVTDTPDYLASFRAKGKEETYQLHLAAETANGKKAIDDSVTIRSNDPFTIERSVFPTRIYPPAVYPVTLTVTANEDFQGEVIDRVPGSFGVSTFKSQILNSKDSHTKEIAWNVKWKKGEAHQLSYTIQFPGESPQFYLVGPLQLTNGVKQPVYQEARAWQIAADTVSTIFMESGTDATQDKSFYDNAGSCFTDTTVAHTGPRSLKCDNGQWSRITGVLADAGRRISYYLYITGFPAQDDDITRLQQTDNSTSNYRLGIQASSHKLNDPFTGAVGTTILQTGQWYHIVISYTITSTAEFRVFLNGTQEISESFVSFNTNSANLSLGRFNGSSGTGVLNFDDIYVDDSNALTDTGAISVTNKRPNADGASNPYTTNGTPTGNLTCSTGTHCQYVSEQPLNTSAYLSTTTTSSSENFDAISNVV